jgi:hypothetical protein
MIRSELEGLGAEIRVTCEPGGPDGSTGEFYPEIRVGLHHKI